MIIDERNLVPNEGENFEKNKKQNLYEQLKIAGIEKDLEMVQELLDPNVIGEKIQAEIQRVNNKWAEAFTTRASSFSSTINIILMAIESVDPTLRNKSFDDLKEVLLRNQREVEEIVNSSRSNEELNEDERIALIKKLASQAEQFQVDVNNVLDQLLLG